MRLFRKKSINDMTIENIDGGPTPPEFKGFALNYHAVGPAVTVDQVLRETALYKSVLAYAKRFLVDDNIVFFRATRYGYDKQMTYLIQMYFDTAAPKSINISYAQRQAVLEAYRQKQKPRGKAQRFSYVPMMGDFNDQRYDPRTKPLRDAMDAAIASIKYIIESDVLPRYIRSDEYRAYFEAQTT